MPVKKAGKMLTTKEIAQGLFDLQKYCEQESFDVEDEDKVPILTSSDRRQWFSDRELLVAGKVSVAKVYFA